MTSNRVPEGVPTGGQFAASAKNESGVALTEPTQDDLDFARETLGLYATDEEVRNLADQRLDRDEPEYQGHAAETDATFFPPAPLSAQDVEALIEYKGAFEEGYDDEKINRVLGRFESARLTCVWDEHDSDGYHGGSEIYGVALEGYSPSQGHFSERPTGSYRALHPDVHEYLFDADSDVDPESIPSLLADQVFEGGDPARDMSDLDGDGFRNTAITSTHVDWDAQAPSGYDEDGGFSGSGWGTHRPTEVVTDIAKIRVGDVLAEQNEQFGARNLLRVTSIDSERGVLHGFFVDPHIPEAKRLGSDFDQAVWDSDFDQGGYSFTDIRGPE